MGHLLSRDAHAVEAVNDVLFNHGIPLEQREKMVGEILVMLDCVDPRNRRRPPRAECFKGGCHKAIWTWERVDGGMFHENFPSGLCRDHARVGDFAGTIEDPMVIIGGRRTR